MKLGLNTPRLPGSLTAPWVSTCPSLAADPLRAGRVRPGLKRVAKFPYLVKIVQLVLEGTWTSRFRAENTASAHKANGGTDNKLGHPPMTFGHYDYKR